MPADPLQDASAGRGSPFVTSIDTVNGVLEAARDFRRRRLGELNGATPNNPSRQPACYCWVRNDVGSDLAVRSVVALNSTPVISAVDHPDTVNQTPVFPGTAPAAATDVFAILVEPIETGKIGIAVVMGMVVCDLAVSDATHTFAVPVIATTATLASATSGPAQIIWKETGTGTKRAVVLITEQQPASSTATATYTSWKDYVRCASVSNVNISNPGTSTFDTVVMSTGSTLPMRRILLKNQTAGAENGIYQFNGSAVAMTRTDDADSGDELSGAIVYVQEGTQGTQIWECVTTGVITIGVTSTLWKLPYLATTDFSGDVSTTTQSFRGTKTFTNGASSATNPASIKLDPAVAASSGTSTLTVQSDGTPTLVGRATLAATPSGSGLNQYGYSSPGTGAGDTTRVSSAVGSSTASVSAIFYPAGSGTGYGASLIGGNAYSYLTFYNPIAFGGAANIFYSDADPMTLGVSHPTVSFDSSVSITYVFANSFVGTTIYGGAFASYDGAGSTYPGLTGTIGYGATSRKGLVTALGSSFGTLATQNGTFSGTHSGTSSGTNTGNQTITLTGNVTGSGTGSFATTIAAGSVAFSMLVGTDITAVGTVTTGTWQATPVGVAYGGTGAATANDGLNALLPSQAGAAGKVLTSDGTNASWV